MIHAVYLFWFWILYKIGKRQQAIASLTKYLDVHPGDINARLMRSKIVFEDNHLADAALVDATLILHQAPHHANALIWRSYLYLAIGDSENALKDADHALAINSGLTDALNNRGRAFLNLGKTDEAMIDLNRAILLNKQALYFRNRGDIWKAVKEYEFAIEDYTTAIRLKKDANTYVLRGYIYTLLDGHAEALRDYDRALVLNPNHFGALNNKAYSLYKLGKPAEGLTFSDRAIALRPENSAFLHTRGKLLSEIGRVQDAVRDYRESLKYITAEDEDIRAEMEEYIQKHTGTAFPDG